MDWIRLGNSGVDLTGVGGVRRSVTLSELANHNKQTDAWIAIQGLLIFTIYTVPLREESLYHLLHAKHEMFNTLLLIILILIFCGTRADTYK